MASGGTVFQLATVTANKPKRAEVLIAINWRVIFLTRRVTLSKATTLTHYWAARRQALKILMFQESKS